MVQKRKTKSKSKSSIKERKEKVLGTLEDLGGQVYKQILKSEFPSFRMPSRSISNILYDDKTRQYILGKRSVKRSARNVRHVRRRAYRSEQDQHSQGCLLLGPGLRDGLSRPAGERQSNH